MKLNERFEKQITWVKENKGKIIIGVCIITAAVIGATYVRPHEPEENETKEIEPKEEFDYGKELEMQFVDPSSGEVLGKMGCYESYMKDMLECE